MNEKDYVIELDRMRHRYDVLDTEYKTLVGNYDKLADLLKNEGKLPEKCPNCKREVSVLYCVGFGWNHHYYCKGCYDAYYDGRRADCWVWLEHPYLSGLLISGWGCAILLAAKLFGLV